MSLATMYRARQRMTSQAGAPPAAPTDWGNEGSIATGQGQVAGQAAGMGAAATSDAYGRISGFDPTQAINRYAQGSWNQTIGGPGGFNDQLTKLRGNEVAGGRLDTGFHDEDTGQLYRSTVNDFSNNLSQTAVQGARMQQDNNTTLANFGNTQQELGLDLGTARREELINNAREKAERKRRNKRGIAGAIGGGLGALAGGFLSGGNPMGIMAGYSAGSKLGGG